MPYNVNLSNGDLLAIVEDGTAEISKSSVALIGKNFPGYGEYINENFVHLVENFASDESPANQLTGQLWYQLSTGELKIWNSQEWVSAGKPTITNDTVSSVPQFLTFVSASSGSPDFKVSASRGITFIPNSGRFGIGVANPFSKLTVSDNANIVVASPSPNEGVVLHTHGDNGKNNILLVDSYGGAGGNYSSNNKSSIALRRSNGTSSSLEAVRNNDSIGSIDGQGYNGTSMSLSQASINIFASENWSTGSNGTRIVFRTTENGSTVSANAVSILNNKTLEAHGDVKVDGSITAAGTLVVEGFIKAGGDVTAYYTSDQRLKIDIQQISNALEKTNKLDGVTFAWNSLAKEKFGDPREPGLIAQQVEQVLPEAVTKREDGYLAVRYDKVIPLLVEAIKDLTNEVNALKAKLEK